MKAQSNHAVPWVATHHRTIHVIRHEFYLQSRNIAFASVGVAGVVLLFALLRWIGGIIPINLWPVYEEVMALLGVLITIGIFPELRSPGRRIEFLLRPAGSWEKILAKLTVSTVGVWAAVTLAFLAASVVGIVLYLVAGGSLAFEALLRHALGDGALLGTAWRTFLGYLPIQAVFFFGAVYFQKHHAAKTLLSIVGWVTSYGILSTVAARIIFHRYFVETIPHSGARRFGRFEGPITELDITPQMWREIAPFYLQNPEMVQMIAGVATVLLFWSLAILRLRETEG